MSDLLSLEQVQDLAIGLAPLGAIETRPVAESIGLAMAENLYAKRTHPPADLSAMDGYAIAGEGPWQRVGASRAGTPYAGELKGGECVRISTGAFMPEGSDRVLIQENAKIKGNVVHLAEGETMPTQGRHVRPKGSDFEKGNQVLANPGELIGAGQLALIMAAGIEQVAVTVPARVAIIECGDELSEDANQCDPYQIPATNGAMIAALLRETGCKIKRSPPVPDSKAALIKAFGEHADADILIVSGGASVGDHDHVKEALVEWGADVHAWKAAIKPGKPIIVAKRDDLAVIGLPGNPASSFVTAFLFALPMVRKTMGMTDIDHLTVMLPTFETLPETGSRREFLRGRLYNGTVRLAGSQDSSALTALAQANCLIDRPAHSPEIEAGTTVPCLLLKNG